MTRMRIIKEIVYRLLALAGLARLATHLNRHKAVVLAYHDVYAGVLDPVRNDGIRVRVKRFERQMRYLAARYDVVPLSELLDGRSGHRGGKPVAAITFDDGYRTTYACAFPILRRLGLPATVFVITDFSLHGVAPWWDRLAAMLAATQMRAVAISMEGTERRFLLDTTKERQEALRSLAAELKDWPRERREELLTALAADLGIEERQLATGEALTTAELREMSEAGIMVGSHGCSHDSFVHLDEARLRAELAESRRVLEGLLGRPVEWLAYPYGDFSRDAIEAAIETGYRGAVTTVEGLNDGIPDPYTIRRIGIDDNLSLARFIVLVSGVGELLRGALRIRRPAIAFTDPREGAPAADVRDRRQV